MIEFKDFTENKAARAYNGLKFRLKTPSLSLVRESFQAKFYHDVMS